MAEFKNLWKNLCDSKLNGGLQIPSVKRLFAKPEMVIPCFKRVYGSSVASFEVDIDTIIGSHTVIFGTTGQGKSNVSGLLLENIFPAIEPESRQCAVPIFFIDTMGEHKSIFDLYPEFEHNVYRIKDIIESEEHVIVGKGKSAHQVTVLHTYGRQHAKEFCEGRLAYYFDVSNYSREPEKYYQYLYDFIDEAMKVKEEAFKNTNQSTRSHLFYIGEVHMFIPQIFRGDEEVIDICKALKNKFIIMAKMGRKWGMPLIVDSQRPADVEKNFSSQCSNRILLPVVDRPDLEYYLALLPSLNRRLFEATMADLAAGNRAKTDIHKGGAIIKFITTGAAFEIGYFRRKESEDLGRTPNFSDSIGWKYGGEGAQAGGRQVAEQKQPNVSADPYQLLQIGRGATDSEIKDAWRRMCMAWHPDKHTNDVEGTDYANEMLKRINAAYAAIKAERTPK